MKYLKMLRPHQYYKNLVIFIAILFTGNFLHINDLKLTALGFIALCLVSSANYIINDIKDRDKDRRHPNKKDRPIAKGEINIMNALIIAFALFAGSYYLAYYLNIWFAYSVATLFILTQLYTFALKKEPYIDIIMIGINFVIRAVSGAFIINADISPWLIICAFFFALFLAAAKRKADMSKKYTKDELSNLITVTMAIAIACYTLYTFLKADRILMLTVPVVCYALFRYNSLSIKGSVIAAKPELGLIDIRLLSSTLIWGAMVFTSVYV